MRLTNHIDEMQAVLAHLEEQQAPAAELARQHFTLAVAFLRKQATEQAIAYLKQSLSYDDTNAIAYAYLGAALVEKQQVDEAKEALKKALVLAPDEMLVQLKMGEFQYKLGFYPEAVKYLEAAVQLQAPNQATAQYLVALLEKARRANAKAFIRESKVLDFKKIAQLFLNLTKPKK